MKATFNENKQIWKNTVRVLLNCGIGVKRAITLVKESNPYLFLSMSQLKAIEDSFKLN